MSEHIGRMDEMRNQLADLGEKHSVYQVTLIDSLPSEYFSIMEVWELTHPSMRTTPNLVARLLKREEDLKKSGDQALLMRANKSRLTRQELEELKKNTRCVLCRVIGHWAKECPNNNNGDRHTYRQSREERANYTYENQASDEDGIVFNVVDLKGSVKDKWVSDSGASCHMSNNARWFKKLEVPTKPRFVFVGDGKRLEVTAVGIIDIESLVGDKWIPSKLSNVLLVPDLQTNLFSIGAAAEKGVNTLFSGHECHLTLNGKMVASGAKLNEKIYLMRIRVRPNSSDQALLVAKPKSMDDYHRRLGHVGVDRIRQLLIGIDPPSRDTVDCEACLGGKARHSSHPPSDKANCAPGHIHADLSGVINKVSFKGYRHYLLCKDESTDFVFMYPCRAKSEVPNLIAKLLIDFETLSSSPVRTLHTDNGSEFVNRITELLFLKNNVRHITSAPFTPQQNGRIEREMQSITNMARTMLNSSRLPKELWPEAASTAVYLKNRLPNSANQITPFERLLSKKPRIEHIAEFGSPIHIIVNDQYLTKWDSRTIEGNVVGFTSRFNTYRVFLPSKNRVVETCDVIFAKHSTHPIIEASKSGRPDNSLSEVVLGGGLIGSDHLRSELDHKGSCTKSQEGGTSDDGSIPFETPMKTALAGEQSTPYEPVRKFCTGSKLDDFFQQYVNQENVYEEPKSQPTYMNISPGIRPTAPPPPPPEIDGPYDDLSHERERTPPSYSALTQNSSTEEYQANSTEFAGVVAEEDSERIPMTFQQALTSEDKDDWLRAIESELEAHAKNETWQIVDRTSQMRLLSTKWVFTIKRDAMGKLEKYKARSWLRTTSGPRL